MGVWVIGGDDYAVLADSVTETGFGPIIRGCPEHLTDPVEEGEMFLEWLKPIDARELEDDALKAKHREFKEARSARAFGECDECYKVRPLVAVPAKVGADRHVCEDCKIDLGAVELDQ